MRILRNGILFHDLVQVPVGIANATSSKSKITFKTLHKACETPIKTEKECVTCHASHLGEDDLVKGYEFAKGEFVVVSDQELESVDTTHSSLIEISKTIPDSSLDALWIKTSYWLVPGVASMSYRLLAHALEAERLVAIGICRLWNEAPFAVESIDGTMMMHLLHTSSELVEVDFEVPALDEVAMAPSLTQAQRTVRSWLGEIDPADLHSEPDRLKKELLAAKIEGTELPSATVHELPKAPDDLLEAFKLSMRGVA